MVTYRTLVQHEYPELKGIADGFVPEWGASIAILARDSERTVGRILLLAPTHLEGIWVEEGYRNREVADKLMERAEAEASLCGVKKLFAYAISPAIERRLSGLGYKKQDLTVWAKEL